jgi:putative ABC transport system permease protein
MNKLNLIISALITIKQNKFRTFLTMLGIIIGVTSVVIMLAIGEGSSQSIQESISSLGSNMLMVHPGAEQQGGMRMDRSQSQTLKLKDYEALKEKNKYIEYISPSVQSSGQVVYGNTNWPTTILGYNTDGFSIKKYELAKGTFFTERDVQTAAKSVVIGQTIVDNLFPNGEDPVGKVIRFNKIPFVVVGVLQEKGSNTFGQDQDDIIIAPYTTVQKRILAITYLNEIIMSSTSENTSDAAMAQAEEILRESHKLKEKDESDFTIRSQQEIMTTLSSTSEMMTILLVTIAAFSLLVGGIGIMNIMYVSVKERTREIGLRLSVGAKGKDILRQFLLEALLISITGGVIGLLAGLFGAWFVSNYVGWPVLITGTSIFLSFAVCSFTGIFFGMYPAYKASKLDPITALRYE